MLEIDVFLGLDPKNKITQLQPDPAASHSGDEIMWHFHAIDNTIKYVAIEFDKKVNFFDSRKGPTHQRHAKLMKKTKGGKGGHGHIFGVTPSIGAGNTEGKKYTVKAYDGDPLSGGKELKNYTYDPTIVTCDP